MYLECGRVVNLESRTVLKLEYHCISKNYLFLEKQKRRREPKKQLAGNAIGIDFVVKNSNG